MVCCYSTPLLEFTKKLYFSSHLSYISSLSLLFFITSTLITRKRYSSPPVVRFFPSFLYTTRKLYVTYITHPNPPQLTSHPPLPPHPIHKILHASFHCLTLIARISILRNPPSLPLSLPPIPLDYVTLPQLPPYALSLRDTCRCAYNVSLKLCRRVRQ